MDDCDNETLKNTLKLYQEYFTHLHILMITITLPDLQPNHLQLIGNIIILYRNGNVFQEFLYKEIYKRYGYHRYLMSEDDFINFTSRYSQNLILNKFTVSEFDVYKNSLFMRLGTNMHEFSENMGKFLPGFINDTSGILSYDFLKFYKYFNSQHANILLSDVNINDVDYYIKMMDVSRLILSYDTCRNCNVNNRIFNYLSNAKIIMHR